MAAGGSGRQTGMIVPHLSHDLSESPGSGLIAAAGRQLATSSLRLAFPPALEARFAKDIHAGRSRYLLICGLSGVLLYDSFVIADWQIFPEMIADSFLFRFAVFTPAALIPIVLSARAAPMRIQNLSWSLLGIVGTVLISITFLRMTNPHRIVYPYGAVLVMTFGATALRPRLGYVLLGLLGACAAVVTCMIISSAYRAESLGAAIGFFLTATVLLAGAGYLLEREERQNYLLELRSTLLNEQLDHSAKLDPLTGLWNRRHLNAVTAAAWTLDAGQPVSMSFIIADIDHFKLFNDSQGHIEGDVCLQRVADCFREGLSDQRDVAVRFGGEEFILFLPHTSADAALAAAERMREALHRQAIAHPALGQGRIVTASFGVATALVPELAPSGLMASADAALYRAKGRGRDRIETGSSPAAVAMTAVA